MLINRSLKCALVVSAMSIVGAGVTQAAPTTILTLGDSITKGEGDSTGLGGYRGALQNRLVDSGYVSGVDFDFIGGFNKGSGTLNDGSAFDGDTWSKGGYEAYEIASDLNTRPYSFGPTEAEAGVFGAAGTVADVVLLHIGTNSITYQASSVDTAIGHLGTLFNSLYGAWNAGMIAADASIIVADIIPKAASNTTNTNVGRSVLQNSFAYNQRIDDVIATLSSDFQDLFKRVNAFAAADWINNYDEATGEQLGTMSPNTDLWGPRDFIHPDEAGYGEIANVFYDKMEEHKLISAPTPAAAGLGFACMTLLALRRRRSVEA